jgi:hypothetical protein
VRAIAGVVRRSRGPDSVLLVRRPSRGLLGGLWELPNVEGRELEPLVALLRERFGIETRPGQRLGKVEHLFTHRALTLDVVELDPAPNSRLRRSGVPVRWCARSDLDELPLSALMKKTLRVAGVSTPPAARSATPTEARTVRLAPAEQSSACRTATLSVASRARAGGREGTQEVGRRPGRRAALAAKPGKTCRPITR